MAEILHSLIIKAPTTQVYAALTETKGLANWWTRSCSGQSQVDSVLKFAFNRGEVTFKMRVIRLLPNRTVTWRCIEGVDEWRNTQIIFELEALRQGTRLHFTHSGWTRTDQAYPVCNYEWATYLNSLRSYLEKGHGFPAKG